MSKLFIRRLMIDFREKLELKGVEFDEKTMFLAVQDSSIGDLVSQ